MFVRRLTTSLKQQHWMTIVIELVIVIVGVFIGTQVSNWNEVRVEQRDNLRVLGNLRPEIASMVANFATIGTYYDTERRYADVALAGLRGDPRVSDRDFVVGAYQASQIYVTGVNSDTWSQIYGSDRLRTISDRSVRKDLSVLMTTDYASMEQEVFSDYRQHARQDIPADVQDAIRAQCGDRSIGGGYGSLMLPKTCALDVPAPRIAVAAAALRAHPELASELNWHLAAIAAYRSNIGTVDTVARDLLARLGKA
ncbi:MAG: hypothetical protein ABIR86_03890 [Sphingomicrobium sp.]